MEIHRSDFTSRELSILHLLRDGKNLNDIADIFEVTKSRINQLCIVIRAKLHAKTNIQAVALAIRYRIISNNGD